MPRRTSLDSFPAGRSALEALIASLPASAVLVVDPDLRCVLAGGEALAGAPAPPGAPARPLAEVLGRPLAASFEPHVREALAGRAFATEHESEGRIFVSRGVPLRDTDGAVEAALILSHDVTERRRAWLAQRDTLGMQAFLFRLTDRLRGLDDPEEIEFEAARALGEHLGVTRVGYAEHDEPAGSIHVMRSYADGVAAISGRRRYGEYSPELIGRLRAGRTIVRPDIAGDERIGAAERSMQADLEIGASVNVPLVKGGRLAAVLFVHHRDPRAFSETDVALIEAVADQTWAAVERARVEAELRQERSRAQLALDAASLGSFVWDAANDRTECDERMLALFGLTPEDGLSLADALARLIHEDDRERYAAGVARALDPDGRGELREEIRVVHPDGTERWLAVLGRTTFAPGRARGLTIAGAAFDVTRQKRTEEERHEREERERRRHARTELLADLAIELDAAGSIDARLARLVELLVPRAADAAWVERPDAPTIRAGAHGADADLVSVPLIVSGRRLATLGLAFAPHPERNHPERGSFVAELRARLEINLAAEELREREHGIAVGLQRALLPDRLVAHPDVPVAARYAAGGVGLEVGGDWYETFLLASGALGVCVGDVVGHGLAAAAAMGRMRVALATLAANEPDPGRVLAQLDEIAAGPNGAAFVTVAYAILDPASGELRHAAAGHPPILAVDPDGTARWLEGGRTAPLSGAPIRARPAAFTTLAPGTLLVLYSDGLIERRGEVIDRGLERLADAAVRLREHSVEEICDTLVEELGDAGRRTDDLVVVCLRVPER